MQLFTRIYVSQIYKTGLLTLHFAGTSEKMYLAEITVIVLILVITTVSHIVIRTVYKTNPGRHTTSCSATTELIF